jgi:hypothetical protein
LPDFYQVAYHSEGYIRASWTEKFDMLGYLTHGCQYAQDLVILRVKERGAPKRSLPELTRKLPLAAIDTPLISTVIDESVLTQNLDIRGWAFNPDGKVPSIEFWIDGKSIGTCTPSGSLPHVLRAFPTTPAAERAGFSLTYPMKGMAKGTHILWITLQNDPMPLWATFFRCSRDPWPRFAARLTWKIRCGVRLRTRLRGIFHSMMSGT